MSNVVALRPTDRLSDTQKLINRMALLPMRAYDYGHGVYADRTDVGIDAHGFLLVPCFECAQPVRTLIDQDVDGESPLAHSDDEGAYYEGDCVTCKRCVTAGMPVAA